MQDSWDSETLSRLEVMSQEIQQVPAENNLDTE